MKFKIVILGIILCSNFFLGCKKSSEKRVWAEKFYGKQETISVNHLRTNSDSLTIINVKKSDVNNSINLSGLISEFDYIPLGTSKKTIIGSIDKIIVKDSSIYILDKFQSKSLFVYNWEGKLKSLLNNRGNGPQEYGSIKDMTILDSGEILIFDDIKNKMIKYDENCKFISSKKIKFNYSFINSINENEYVFSTNFSSQNHHIPQIHCYNLIYTDSLLNIKKVGLPYKEKNLFLRVSNGHDFFENDKTKYYHPFLGDTIYQLNGKDNLLAKYHISFEGKVYTRKKLINKKINNTDDGFNFNRTEQRDSNYLLHPFGFSNKVDFFTFSNLESGMSYIYYDKIKNKAHIGSKFELQNIDNAFVFNNPELGYKNYLISYTSASVFVKGWEAFKKQNLHTRLTNNKIKIYDSVKPNDNPIIILAKIK